MPDKTYADLAAAPDVESGDLLATYRGSGPLKKLTVAQFTGFLETEFLPLEGGTLLGGLTFAPSATDQASANFPDGVAPDTPNDGDFWREGATLNLRLDAATRHIAFTDSALDPVTLSTADAQITGGSISGITDLAIEDGGTAASDAGTARANLGLALGVDVQPWSQSLEALGALTPDTNQIAYFTDDHSAALTSFTVTGRDIVAATDAADARGIIGALASAGDTMTGLLVLAASDSASASLNLPDGAAPSAPQEGDLWVEDGDLLFHHDAASRTIAFTDSALSGDTTGSAATLTTPRTIALTGDVAYTSGAFDGSDDVTGTATLASVITAGGPVGSATAVPVITWDAKGRLTAVSTAALGTAAAADVGTSGSAVPRLNGANTWTAAQTFLNQTNPIDFSGTAAFSIRFKNNSTTKGLMGLSFATNDLVQTSVAGDLVQRTSAGAWIISTDSGNTASFRVLGSSGGVQINNGPKWASGSGSPEGVLAAAVGSLYSRTDGGAGTSLYVKESGSGTTGWAAK